MTEMFSLESERAILGLLMTVSSVDGPGAATLLLEREHLTAMDFHVPAHLEVYTAVQGLLKASLPADPISIFEKVKSSQHVTKAGGLKWLLEIGHSSDGLIEASFPNYSTQVRELAVRRRVVSEARQILSLAENPMMSVADLLSASTNRFANISFRKDNHQTLTQVMLKIQSEIQKTNDAKATRLISTGIDRLDRVIGGYPPMLVIVGGRPGGGKSAMAATSVQSMAASGRRLGVFSLEDRAPWLGYRLLSSHSGISNQKLRFEKLSEGEWIRAGEGFTKVNRYGDNVLIDDRRRMTASDIVQSARNMILNHGAEIILVDHLLEVKASKQLANRTTEIEESLTQLRDLANEYELPVVVFTQLSRAAEGKTSVAMTDFKDSGAIEQQGRIVIGLTRKDDVISFHVIKNTNGKLGRIDAEFIGAAAMVASTERMWGPVDVK